MVRVELLFAASLVLATTEVPRAQAPTSADGLARDLQK